MNAEAVYLRIESDAESRTAKSHRKRTTICWGRSACRKVERVQPARAAYRVQDVVGGTEIYPNNGFTGGQSSDCYLANARSRRERSKRDQIVGCIDSVDRPTREGRTGTPSRSRRSRRPLRPRCSPWTNRSCRTSRSPRSVISVARTEEQRIAKTLNTRFLAGMTSSLSV